MINEQDINNAFTVACKAREDLHYHGDEYEMAKLLRESKVAIGVFEGHIEGKNKEQRDAHAMVLYGDQFVDEEAKATSLRQAKLNYDLAIFELSRVKALLRLMEVETQRIVG